MVVSVLLKKEVNKNWIRTKYHLYRQQNMDSKKKDETIVDEAAVLEGQVPGPKSEDIPSREITPPSIPNPYTGTISLHIHHWQIFYVLAFFTRYVRDQIIDTLHTDACL